MEGIAVQVGNGTAYIPPGSPAALNLPNTTATIPPVNPPDLQGTLPIKIPEQPQTDLNALVNSFTTQAADSTQKETDQVDVIGNLLGQLEGQNAEQAALENQVGRPQLDKDLLELTNKARQQTTEFNQAYLNAEGKQQTRAETTVAQQNLQRQRAIDVMITNSLIAAKQGQIEYANSIVDRAIKAKYEPLKARIETQKFLLEGLKTKAAEDRKNKLNLQMKALEKQEEEDKLIQSMIIEAANAGAPLSLIEKAKSAGSAEGVASLVGKYSASYLDRQLKQAQLANIYSTIAERNKTIEDSKKTTAVSSKMDADDDFKKLKGNAELKSALIAYQSAVEEGGAKRKDTAGGANLDTLYQDVLQAYRAAKNLGALQGPDLQLVDDAIKRATFEKTGTGKVTNVALFGIPTTLKRAKTEKNALSSIATAFDTVDRNTERFKSIISSKNPDWVDTDYFKAVIGGSGLSNEDLLNMIPTESLETNEEFFGK